MSRVMDRNGSLQAGSRIPRFSGAKNSPPAKGFQPEPLPNIQKPSRLQQMQADYQRGIMKEKEEKLINLYEDNQHKALQRVNQKKGHVREFFNERRTVVKGDASMSPTMEQLYQQKKSASQISGSGYDNNNFANRQSPKYNNNYNNKVVNPPRGVQKQSAGRDRSNLLAPIQRNGQQDDENPFARRKPQIVRPRTYGQQRYKENTRNGSVPQSAPTGMTVDNFSNYEYDDDSPPPNAQQLQHLQQKRKMLQSQRSHTRSMQTRQNGSSMSNQTSLIGGHRRTPESSRKLISSRNTGEFEPSDEDEGFGDNNSGGDDDMKKKQQELLAQIQAQQHELDRLRNERKQVETEEAKEAERRRKYEEERRKKQAEEDRRRLKAEEEERMRQQWEEEKQKKIESEKRRMRHTSQTSHDNDHDYHNDYNRGAMLHNDYEDKQPTPPPKPQPAKSRKSVPQKRAPAKNPTPSPPLPKGDTLALYENAINEEGAFESVGRLKACYNCGRKFAADRLDKHEQACKNATKKRKVMDPSKNRTAGTEMESYQGRRKPDPPKAKNSNWRAKRESFIEALRYAKKCSQIEKDGGNLADLPPPPRSENPDYVQCPHCTRKFNVSAAERHIPHCANTKGRAKAPPRRR